MKFRQEGSNHSVDGLQNAIDHAVRSFDTVLASYDLADPEVGVVANQVMATLCALEHDTFRVIDTGAEGNVFGRSTVHRAAKAAIQRISHQQMQHRVAASRIRAEVGRATHRRQLQEVDDDIQTLKRNIHRWRGEYRKRPPHSHSRLEVQLRGQQESVRLANARITRFDLQQKLRSDPVNAWRTEMELEDALAAAKNAVIATERELTRLTAQAMSA